MVSVFDLESKWCACFDCVISLVCPESRKRACYVAKCKSNLMKNASTKIDDKRTLTDYLHEKWEGVKK